MDIKRASAPHNHQHGSSAVLRLGEKSYSHQLIIISLELSSHRITHRHPIFWISQENLIGITMCKSNCQISNLNRIVVNLFSLCSDFGNNRKDAAQKNIERPIPSSSCQRGSSSSVHLVLLWYLCFCQFTRWLPRLCFPHVSLFRRKARLVCTIGTSPLSMR